MHRDPMTQLPVLERAWMNACIAKDRDTCDRVLDQDFLLSSARSVLIRKSQWLAGAMAHFNCTAFKWLEVLVRPFDNVAIAHSRIRQQASVGARDWSGLFMLTEVWVLRGSEWKIVSRHGAGPLPEPAA